MAKIFVAPRCWTKLAENLFVFFGGNHNTWVEHAAGNLKFGATGLWGVHRGPYSTVPKSWDQVVEKKTVRIHSDEQ